MWNSTDVCSKIMEASKRCTSIVWSTVYWCRRWSTSSLPIFHIWIGIKHLVAKAIIFRGVCFMHHLKSSWSEYVSFKKCGVALAFGVWCYWHLAFIPHGRRCFLLRWFYWFLYFHFLFFCCLATIYKGNILFLSDAHTKSGVQNWNCWCVCKIALQVVTNSIVSLILLLRILCLGLWIEM